jgi:hypothetical protein
VIDVPDFRSDPSESPEGRGLARDRWHGFLDAIPDEVLADAYPSPRDRLEDHDEDVRDDIARAVREDADLIGFWVAWHEAGGFAALERGGWHRATIYRKVRKFRSRYGMHPDEYRFSWIDLDLKRCWTEEITFRLNPPPEPELD